MTRVLEQIAYRVTMIKSDVVNISRSAAHVENILFAVLHVVEDGSIDAYKRALIRIQEAEANLNEDLCRLNAHNGGVSASIEAIVKITGRLHVIQATSYISAGYALMNLALCLIFALMTASNWPLSSAKTVAITYTIVITYLYTYLRLMINDLEDPFEYPEGYCMACYISGKALPIGTWEEFRKGGSIPSISMLTVTFGTHLRALMAADYKQRSNVHHQTLSSGEPSPVWPPVNGCEVGRRLSVRIQEMRIFHGVSTGNDSIQMHESAFSAKRVLAQWRLALRCIPVVAVAVGMRQAVWYGSGMGGWIDQSVFTSFISLAIFVSAIVMQGLVQDYKEAEKMPSELASAFYALTGAIEVDSRWAAVVTASAGPSSGIKSASLQESLEHVHKALMATFAVLELPDCNSAPFVYSQAMIELEHAQTSLCFMHDQLERSVKAVFTKTQLSLVYPGSKFDKPFDRLRAVLGRMYAIQKTSYILEGYTLMDLMMAAVIVLMTATNWPWEIAESTAMAFTISISFLFAYLQFFVRDLEDPFKYPSGHSLRCYNEGKTPESTFLDDHRFADSIDFAPLTVGFGSRLKTLASDPLLQVDNISTCRFSIDLKNRITQQPDLVAVGTESDLVYWVKRFRLMLQAIPFVVCLIAFRYAVWRVAAVSGWIDPAVFRSFVGLVIFVTSLLVQGVVADYKEAEKLPCQLTASLQSLMNAICLGCKVAANCAVEKDRLAPKQVEKELQAVRANCADVVADIDAQDLESQARAVCLYHVQSVLEHSLKVLQVGDSEQEAERVYVEALKGIQAAEQGIFRVFKSGKGYLDGAWDAVGPLVEVRQAVSRVYVIKQTSFTLDGYSLCDGMLLAILVLLTLSDWPEDTRNGTALGTTVILSGLFIYMALLIRSLEDPYKYPTIDPSVSVATNRHGYCERLYRSVQMMIAPKTNCQGVLDICSPQFGLYAAFNCGNPIDLTVLAHGFGYQICRKFGSVHVSPSNAGAVKEKGSLFLEPILVPAIENTSPSYKYSSTLVWCTSAPQEMLPQGKSNEAIHGYNVGPGVIQFPMPGKVMAASLSLLEYEEFQNFSTSGNHILVGKTVQFKNISTLDEVYLQVGSDESDTMINQQIPLSGRA